MSKPFADRVVKEKLQVLPTKGQYVEFLPAGSQLSEIRVVFTCNGKEYQTWHLDEFLAETETELNDDASPSVN